MTRERWIIGGVSALVFILVAVGIALAVSGGDDSNVSVSATTTSSTTTTTLPPTTTTVTVPVTVGTICTTPDEAAMSFVEAWIAGNKPAAARCATGTAVDALFQNSGAGAQYMWQGCSGDPGAPTCSYTYEGGALNIAVTGTDATGWKVQSISYFAD